MSNKSTPHLNALEVARSEVRARTMGCPCDYPPRGKTPARTAWLKQHGRLCKKSTKRGWRRAWQCNWCFSDMGGDGINAGPPTQALPEFFEHDHPVRRLVSSNRLAEYRSELAKLPARRSEWFKDHDLYLQSDAWKALRKAVLQRDGFRCVRCRRPAVQVHHLTYERWQSEELSDLISLCKACHEEEHAG